MRTTYQNFFGWKVGLVSLVSAPLAKSWLVSAVKIALEWICTVKNA